jgi:hypothetical protein
MKVDERSKEVGDGDTIQKGWVVRTEEGTEDGTEQREGFNC